MKVLLEASNSTVLRARLEMDMNKVDGGLVSWRKVKVMMNLRMLTLSENTLCRPNMSVGNL